MQACKRTCTQGIHKPLEDHKVFPIMAAMLEQGAWFGEGLFFSRRRLQQLLYHRDVEGLVNPGTALGKPWTTRGEEWLPWDSMDFRISGFPDFLSMIPDTVASLRLALVRVGLFYFCNSSVAMPCRELAKVSAPSCCTGLSDRCHHRVCVAMLFLLSPPWQERAGVCLHCKADERHLQNGGWFGISSV